LLYAASIADQFSSSLLVLHVVTKEVETYTKPKQLEQQGIPRQPFALLGPFSQEVQASTGMLDVVAVDLREQARVALQQTLPPQLAGHPLELRVEVGDAFEQILATARNQHVDLIVMGTHGRTGLAHVMVGSVAERVVRLAPCPVMTVKAAAPPAS
jgi:nucleotide-binding universal stress UspA family protein